VATPKEEEEKGKEEKEKEEAEEEGGRLNLLSCPWREPRASTWDLGT
jgi:hypothetical protein